MDGLKTLFTGNATGVITDHTVAALGLRSCVGLFRFKVEGRG